MAYNWVSIPNTVAFRGYERVFFPKLSLWRENGCLF